MAGTHFFPRAPLFPPLLASRVAAAVGAPGPRPPAAATGEASAPPFLAYQVYKVAERLATALGKLRPERQQTTLPPPDPFSKR